MVSLRICPILYTKINFTVPLLLLHPLLLILYPSLSSCTLLSSFYNPFIISFNLSLSTQNTAQYLVKPNRKLFRELSSLLSLYLQHFHNCVLLFALSLSLSRLARILFIYLSSIKPSLLSSVSPSLE